MYTPSTKAELGDKDVNISPDEARKIVGDKYASRIEELALECYQAGAEYAAERVSLPRPLTPSPRNRSPGLRDPEKMRIMFLSSSGNG